MSIANILGAIGFSLFFIFIAILFGKDMGGMIIFFVFGIVWLLLRYEWFQGDRQVQIYLKKKNEQTVDEKMNEFDYRPLLMISKTEESLVYREEELKSLTQSKMTSLSEPSIKLISSEVQAAVEEDKKLSYTEQRKKGTSFLASWFGKNSKR